MHSAVDLAPGAVLDGRYRVGEVLSCTDGRLVLHEGTDLRTNDPVELEVSSAVVNDEFVAQVSPRAWPPGPGLVALHSVGRDERTGVGYVARERLDGEDVLSRRIAEIVDSVAPRSHALSRGAGPTIEERRRQAAQLGLAEAVRVAQGALFALGTLHAKGVADGRIRAERLVVDAAWNARLLPNVRWDDYGGFTLQMGGPGSDPRIPAWMAPETLETETASTAADFYSLGAVLYELLAGRPPFEPRRVKLRFDPKKDAVPPPRLKTHRPDVPPAVEAAILRALEPDPRARFIDARAFAKALGA